VKDEFENLRMKEGKEEKICRGAYGEGGVQESGKKELFFVLN